MATVGDLVVNLSANTSRFRKGLQKSRGMVAKFASAAGTAMKVGVGAMAAAGAVGVAMVTRQFGKLDTLAKQSAMLGILPEKLTALQFAFEQTGVSVEGGTKALQRMIRGVSEAATGTGEAKDALEEMGLSAEELVQLTPDKALGKIADAMLGVENHSDKVRLSFDIFGRSGVELINTLQGGAAGLQAFQAQADKLGLGVTAEDLAKVEAANDAMNRLKHAVQGVFRQVAIAIAPAVEAVANWITGSADQWGGFIGIFESGVNFIRDSWIATVDAMAQAFTRFYAFFSGLFGEIGNVMKNLWANMKKNLGSITEWVKSFGREPMEWHWTPVLSGAGDAMAEGQDMIDELNKMQTDAARNRKPWTFGAGGSSAAAPGAPQLPAEQILEASGLMQSAAAIGESMGDAVGSSIRKERAPLGAAMRGSVEAFKLITQAGKKNELQKLAAKRNELLEAAFEWQKSQEPAVLIVQGAIT